MITLTESQARHMRNTFAAVVALLDEKLTEKPKKKRVNRYEQMYVTGMVTKPESLKKRKSR